jgi:flagellar capping protein FliD
VKTGIIAEDVGSPTKPTGLQTTPDTEIPEKIINVTPVGDGVNNGGGVTTDGDTPVLRVEGNAEAKIMLDKAFNSEAGIIGSERFTLRFEAAVTDTAAAELLYPPQAGGASTNVAEVFALYADSSREKLGDVDGVNSGEFTSFSFPLSLAVSGTYKTGGTGEKPVIGVAVKNSGANEIQIRNITLGERAVPDTVALEAGADADGASLGAVSGTTGSTGSIDGTGPAGQTPLNPVSTAQDAIVLMDGIEVYRSTNEIDDLVPGVKLTAKQVSSAPVNVGIEVDNGSVKDSIITMIGNYNRLVAEINVLTRNDETILRELDYLSEDEQAALREKMGKFSGDTALTQLRSRLVSAMNGVYRGSDGGTLMASDMGISSDVQRRGGYDASRMRGYMEIDEKILDQVIASNLTGLKELFGRDSDGDLIVDSGIGYSLDQALRSWVEIGGTIAAKTGAIDTKVSGEQRRIDTLDRQLAQKEQTLKIQYAQMESAYNNIERMSDSLTNFSGSGRNN